MKMDYYQLFSKASRCFNFIEIPFLSKTIDYFGDCVGKIILEKKNGGNK